MPETTPPPTPPAPPPVGGTTTAAPGRPRAVTAALWATVAVAIVHTAGGVALLIAVMNLDLDIPLLAHPEYNAAVWMMIFGLATGGCAVWLRSGADVARTVVFAILVGAAVVWLAAGVEQLARFPFNESPTRVYHVTTRSIAAVIAVTTALTPVVLLARATSARWFHERRGDTTEPAKRPVALWLAATFLTVAIVLEVVDTAATASRFLFGDFDNAEPAWFLAPYLGYAAIPLLVAIAAVVGLFLGGDTARVAACGVAGFFVYNGAYFLWSFVANVTTDSGMDVVFTIGLLLSLLGAVLATAALVCLCLPAVAQWYGWRRFGAPRPAA